MRKAKIAAGKTLLYKEPPYYITLGKELPAKALDEILTDSKEIYEELQEYYKKDTSFDKISVTFYEDTYSLYNLYRFAHYYEEAYGKYIWLKSGASLVIEHTEAMTVIDVNTGKNIAKKEMQENFLKVNIEAAEEIARQLRLRNISGIVIVDFINLEAKSAESELLNVFGAALKKDPVPTQIVEMTKLGLVEVTRKKIKKSLRESLS